MGSHQFLATKSGPPVAPSSPQTFVYVSDGDTNGMLYFIGRNYGVAAWVNPHTATFLQIIRNIDSVGSAPNIVDRIAQDTYTTNVANSWIVVDLKSGKSAIITHYSLRIRNVADPRAMRNWKLQGTNASASNSIADLNAATWTDIDTRVGDIVMANTAGAWGFYTVGGSPSGYRWLRILQNGLNGGSSPDNYLAVCEIELYGELTF